MAVSPPDPAVGVPAASPRDRAVQLDTSATPSTTRPHELRYRTARATVRHRHRGGSGSGKTTIARSLRDELEAHEAVLIEQDCYYRSQSHLSFEERAAVNFDHPDALEL